MHWRHCVSSIIKAHYMLTSDFKEFAALLNSNAVEYRVVGGFLADLEALSGKL